MFRFIVEVIADVARTMLTAEPPSYATVLALDRKVRDFPMPVVELPPPARGTVDAALSMQMYYTVNLRETRTFRSLHC